MSVSRSFFRASQILRAAVPAAELKRDQGICKHSGYPLEGPRGDLSHMYALTDAYTNPEGRYRVGYKPRSYYIRHYERPQEEVQHAKNMWMLSFAGTVFPYVAMARSMVGLLGWAWCMDKSEEALGNVEVDLSGIEKGTMKIIIWRGKPVFLVHRSQRAIEAARSTPLSMLKDPATDEARCPQNPDWLICMGVCTHLGCVPILNQGDYGADGGFLCPCHQSHYDSAARIRRGPAPSNLELPPYEFRGDDKVYLGD